MVKFRNKEKAEDDSDDGDGVMVMNVVVIGNHLTFMIIIQLV